MTDAEELARLEELVVLTRQMAANREATAAQMLMIVRVICRDVLAVLDAPADPRLRRIVVDGARRRAQRILAELGNEETAN
jgi:hypothetical protein